MTLRDNQLNQGPCANCVPLLSYICTRGPEQRIVQLHEDLGGKHVYAAHAYEPDANTEPEWQDAAVMDLSDESPQKQAETIKEFLLCTLEEHYTISPCYHHGYGADSARRWFQELKKNPNILKSDAPIEVVCQFFHLLAEEAGKAMGICPTVQKRILRRHGMERWPGRFVAGVHSRVRQLLNPPPRHQPRQRRAARAGSLVAAGQQQ